MPPNKEIVVRNVWSKIAEKSLEPGIISRTDILSQTGNGVPFNPQDLLALVIKYNLPDIIILSYERLDRFLPCGIRGKPGIQHVVLYALVGIVQDRKELVCSYKG